MAFGRVVVRDWLNDGWHWIGVALIEMPRGPANISPVQWADAVASGFVDSDSPHPIKASLWGIESYSEDYHHTVALELVSEANAA